MTKRYQVLQYMFFEGWVNTWTDGDGVPETFATYDEALAEIDAFFAEIADQIATGERHPDRDYDRDEFKIGLVEPEVLP